MIRTQIYLPEELHRELAFLANQEKTTLSELLRQGAKKIVKDKEKEQASYNWLSSISGMIKNGPKDVSKRMNYYLYVEPYEKKRKQRKKR